MQSVPGQPRSSRRVWLGGLAAFAALGQRGWARASTPVADGWSEVAELALARSEYAATTLDGQIYVAAGFGAELSFDRYDPVDDRWERLADLPAPRHHIALASLDGAIFLPGGLNGETHTAESTVWRYDPSDDRWDEIEPLVQGPRGSLGAGVIDGQLYVVGGSLHDLSGPATTDLVRYDPAAGHWEPLAPMPTAREHLGVGVASGLLVAVGGRDGSHESPEMLSATEIYDPATNSWTAGSEMPTLRAGLGVASDGDAIYVVGGERFSGGEPVTLAAVERYEPAADLWTDLPDLPVARHGMAAAWLDKSLYAIGGSVEAGRIDNVRTVHRIAPEADGTSDD